jgi:predicted transport protein
VELNVQFDPFDKNILTEKEIKAIGYNHFSIDDLAIVLEEKEEIIKKAI